MNIKQAKAIPITDVLKRLDAPLARDQGTQAWYLSPFRSEHTASFHVHIGKNAWYDFGEGKGGSVIDLAVAYLTAAGKSASVKDALALLGDLFGSADGTYVCVDRPSNASQVDEAGHWLMREQKPVAHLALVRYLKGRGIPLALARQHLREVQVQNSKTGTRLFALGFINEDGGWELRNPFLQSAISPKTVTFVRGVMPDQSQPTDIHLFEGWPDFLSVLTRKQGEPMQSDSIILNSLSCIPHALPYMQGYGYEQMFTWMDNDGPGLKAGQVLADFAEAEGIACHAMNTIYAGFKDVNEWHTEQRDLPCLGLRT